MNPLRHVPAGFLLPKIYDMNTDDQPCCCESKAYFSRRIDDLEQKYDNKHAMCDQRHEEHNQYRRANDDKMIPIIKCLQEQSNTQREQSATLTKILAIMQENTPVIDRTKNNFTTWDGIKEAAKNVSLFCAAGSAFCGMIAAAVYGIIHLIQTMQ